MIKKYPWHFIFLIFVILCLANIFQKLKWSAPTDNIIWQNSEEGLVCIEAPENSLIREGDIVLTINKYIINDLIDLKRIIQRRKFCLYEIERNGILKPIPMDIASQYTPLSYYIMVFSGILFILLTLNLLNTQLKKSSEFSIPPLFYMVSLSFTGFLILSPTGDFNTTDFIFFSLDRVAFLLFPAFLLHYAIYFPLKSPLLRKINPRFLPFLIYSAPVCLLGLFAFFLVSSLFSGVPELTTLTLNHFNTIIKPYFISFLLLALALFTVSNLTLIMRRARRRYLMPLISTGISVPLLIVFYTLIPVYRMEKSILLNFVLGLIVLLPLSVVYYLSQRRTTDLMNIIKKTVSVSSIFLFIFGIFFFLGINIEKNKLLGIFWSVAAILTAGLLFKPIEGTVQNFIERLFFKSTFTFKRKLRELMQSLRGERDLSSLSKNFLDTINHGFNLTDSALIIYFRKNIFYSLPEKNKILLSKTFRTALFENDNLVFSSDSEFRRRFPKDSKVMASLGFRQFFPLKYQNKLTGLVAFGPKNDGSQLSIEEWELLFSISGSLTLSVENAFLYSQLENQLSELNLLKEFNENIIENLNLGIVVLTKLNIIKTWNTFMEEKFGILRDRAINKKAHTVLGTSMWKRIQPKKLGVSIISNIKLDHVDDESVFDIYISPLKDTPGNVIGTILVFDDVTEKILIQNQLITTEKMASLGLLSAGIAHEINTPLTGISSYCQFILNNPDAKENQDLVVKIQEQVKRANQIISTLLDFSRQKGERAEALDLNKVINESISLLEHKLKKKNISLVKHFHFKTKVYGYSNRLQQLFINLLINASDAIEHRTGEITLEGEENKESILIRISDNGKGMDPQELDKIFDPFYTTKEPGKGTGLGLSISYNIVKDHYGNITVDSQVDTGSTFTISFPTKSPLRRIRL